MQEKRRKLHVLFFSKLFHITAVKNLGKIKNIKDRIGELKILVINFMLSPCINSIKNTFFLPTDTHCYKIIEMLKQYKNYNICSDMFRFTQEPSSGSSPVLS
jgi:hypothetical protein